MANTYDVGDEIRITAVFKNLSSVATDTTAALKIKTPAKVQSTVSVTKSATGTYYYDLLLNAAGTWWWRWEGTGAVVAAEEGKITVAKSQFT